MDQVAVTFLFGTMNQTVLVGGPDLSQRQKDHCLISQKRLTRPISTVSGTVSALL